MLNYPISVFVDSLGDIFIADWDNHRIRQVNGETDIITTVVGTGEPGYSGDGGDPKAAKLNWPRSLFIDSKGDMYIADELNHRIRKVEGIAAPTKLDFDSFSPLTP